MLWAANPPLEYANQPGSMFMLSPNGRTIFVGRCVQTEAGLGAIVIQTVAAVQALPAAPDRDLDQIDAREQFPIRVAPQWGGEVVLITPTVRFGLPVETCGDREALETFPRHDLRAGVEHQPTRIKNEDPGTSLDLTRNRDRLG